MTKDEYIKLMLFSLVLIPFLAVAGAIAWLFDFKDEL